MKEFFKTLSLLILSFVLSLYLSHNFGRFYELFSPHITDSSWIGSRGSLEFLAGFPFAWIFFVFLFFLTFRPKHYKGWVSWLTAASFILYGAGDLMHIYLPIGLALIAWGIALSLRKIFHRKPV